MFKILVLIYIAFTVCEANISVRPPVLCGYVPENLYKCLKTPEILKPDVTNQCAQDMSECDRITCLFEKAGWMTGDKVNKENVKVYFDQIARENPEWEPAVASTKTSCLTTELPVQGVHLKCPAYDVSFCIYASFIKNAQPSQWASTERCQYPRQFAAACPICPEGCFAAQIPIGSCNACLALPRSP